MNKKHKTVYDDYRILYFQIQLFDFGTDDTGTGYPYHGNQYNIAGHVTV